MLRYRYKMYRSLLCDDNMRGSHQNGNRRHHCKCGEEYQTQPETGMEWFCPWLHPSSLITCLEPWRQTSSPPRWWRWCRLPWSCRWWFWSPSGWAPAPASPAGTSRRSPAASSAETCSRGRLYAVKMTFQCFTNLLWWKPLGMRGRWWL